MKQKVQPRKIRNCTFIKEFVFDILHDNQIF